jgi:outer membrane receptor protein involved in Fe transport
MRLEYTIDSANSVIWSPRFSTQQNDGNYTTTQSQYYFIDAPELQADNISGSKGLGYNYSSDLVFRHKFAKKGRTVSLGINLSGNLQNSDGTNWSQTVSTRRINPDSVINTTTLVDQNSNSKTKGETYSANLAYTEPIGKNGILQFGYNATFNNNNTDRRSYDQKVTPPQLDTALSSVYKSNYNTQRGGLSYRVRGGDKLNASFGIDYQRADLAGERTFPQTANVSKSFENILPNLMLNYKFSQTSNLRVFYRTSTNPPSVNQLQDVVIVSSPTSFSIGNPELKHQYSHIGVFNFRTSNPKKSTNFSFNFFGGYTKNSIGNAVSFMSKDSVIIPGDTLKRLGQLTKPVNFKDAWNGRVFINYGYLFQPLKVNINLIGGAGYTLSPGSINNILNLTNQYNLTGGVVLGSNISQNVDFTVTYTGNYTMAKVTYKDSLSQALGERVSSNSNSNTWNHSISVRSNFIWKGFVLQNSLIEQLNRGLSGGYNQNFLQWNLAFGKKFLKNNSAELKLSVYDVLNQNQNITHTVSALNITDSRTNTLQRFFLLTFTYNLRNYKAPGNDHDHGPRGFGGPGGPGPGGPGGPGPGGPF